MENCSGHPPSRFRKFWTTQDNACGKFNDCVNESCGIPGLAFEETLNGKTIKNSDYVKGLALNILGTDASTPPDLCGSPPGRMNGYWADDYRTDGLKSGTLMRSLPVNGTVTQQVALIQAYLQNDMSKLVKYGVATEVTVSTVYVGNYNVKVTIVIRGNNGDTFNVNTNVQKSPNGWVWK